MKKITLLTIAIATILAGVVSPVACAAPAKSTKTYMKYCMSTKGGFDTEDNQSFRMDIPLAENQMFMGVFDGKGTKTIKDDVLVKIILTFDGKEEWY